MANLDYKCPNCSGAISFDSKTQNMKCPYCDAEFEVESLKGFDDILSEDGNEDIKWKQEERAGWGAGERDGLATYICNSCGGEIVGDETLGSTSCPYCDNPVVFSGMWSGGLRPDLVIPFKIDKKAAVNAFSKYLKGKLLLPKAFKKENHIEEVKGLYVPFWLFSADTDAHFRFKGSRVRSWSDSDYNYTETSFYSILRDGGLCFKDIPADGSSKMDDKMMQSLEPFDAREAVDFQTAYLAGYLADKYDIDSTNVEEIANTRIRNSVEEEFRATIHGYSGVVKENGAIQISNAQAKYALYPAWILTTRWQDKPYMFAMNGQTGKFVGKLPVDKGMRAAVFAGIATVLAPIVYYLTGFFM